MKLVTLITLLIMTTATASADDFLEQAWVGRRAEIADDEWPIPPPVAWGEKPIVVGNAEEVWDRRWTELDSRFARAVRTALLLARDGHPRAAGAEIPVLVRTLGLINAHSRVRPELRDGRDHALDLAVTKRIAGAILALGRLDAAQTERVRTFLVDFVAAVESADYLEEVTSPMLSLQRAQAFKYLAACANIAGLFTSIAAEGLAFAVTGNSAWTGAIPLGLTAAGFTAFRMRKQVPKRFAPDDRNRVGPRVREACAKMLAAPAAVVPPAFPAREIETKTNLDEI